MHRVGLGQIHQLPVLTLHLQKFSEIRRKQKNSLFCSAQLPTKNLAGVGYVSDGKAIRRLLNHNFVFILAESVPGAWHQRKCFPKGAARAEIEKLHRILAFGEDSVIM